MREFWGRLSTVNKVGVAGGLLGYLVGIAAVFAVDVVAGAVTFSACTLLIVLCVWFFFGREFASSRIRLEGTPAEATVLSIRSTGKTINEVYPEIELQLEVRPSEGQPYRAKARTLIDQVDFSSYQPGDVIPVTVDPRNKKRIAVGRNTYQ